MSEHAAATPRVKWPRTQRFQLSAIGREACRAHRRFILASRVDAGRKPFDAARAEWAAGLGLDASDGLYLNELLETPRTIRQIANALDGCGPQPKEVHAAVERLVQKQMIELTAPPPAPPSPPRRW